MAFSIFRPLTTSIDTVNVEKNGAAIVGTQATFQAADTINGNNHNNLQLKLTDTGTAAWTAPAASVNGIQTVSLQNANGTAAVAGVTETATVTARSIKAGETLVVAGQQLMATSDISAGTVASALAGTATSGTGWTLTGTLSGWTKAAGGAGTNTIVYTSSTPTAPVADLVISGTAQTGIPQVTTLAIATAAAATGPLQFTFNGVTVTAGASTGTAAAQAVSIANAINAYAGSTIATAVGAVVTVISSTPVSLAGFTATGTVTTALSSTYGLAPANQSFTVTTAATASSTVSFYLNGVLVTTGATSATASVTDTATKIVAAINAAVGSPVASNVAGAITVNTVSAGYTVLGFSDSGSSSAIAVGSTTVTTLSSGIVAASPASVVEVQGVAPVEAQTYLDTLHADQFVGATNFISNNSTGAVTVDQLATGQTTQIQGNGSAANGNLVATYLSTATGAATVNVEVVGFV